MTAHATEVSRGDRFEFGENWSRFLSVLNEDRIAQAEKSLREMPGVSNLQHKRFSRRWQRFRVVQLGSPAFGRRCYSFDYDPKSVGRTWELKRRYFAGDSQWLIEGGSVLDRKYLRCLGQFDVVYSWGVLHDTGAMWQALENVALWLPIAGSCSLSFATIRGASRRWRSLKRFYNALSPVARSPYVLAVMGPRELRITSIEAQS